MSLALSPRRVRRVVWFAMLAMLGLYGANDAEAADVATRYKIQAGFLLHLTSYVYWPESSDRRVICLGRHHQFGRFLHDLAAIKRVNDNNERLVVKNIEAVDNLAPCDVLYVPQQLQDQFPLILSRVSKGTLTVSDSSRFISAGGAIEFFMAGENVRMRVHRGHLRRGGLHLSASLLQLVELVDETQAYRLGAR